ncbi:MAG: GlsB/YeaQ/YmgE family stress response membrane protein [Synergistaceae bacterium]|nr:GlsB/YeaQ/YmgE family stress response membrane protein [Synergistaceae bacterium]
MGILAWIVLGGLAGWVASIIMGKNSSMGLIANIVVGIIGSFIGGYIMGTIDKHGVTGLDLRSFLVALLGSVILLAIANFFYKGRAR